MLFLIMTLIMRYLVQCQKYLILKNSITMFTCLMEHVVQFIPKKMHKITICTFLLVYIVEEAIYKLHNEAANFVLGTINRT